MSQSLNNRFFYGNTSFAPLTLERAVILDKPRRDEKLIALSKSQIEAQYHTAREIAKSNIVGAEIVANEISHQTAILEGAINQVSTNVLAIGDQISDAILDVGESICAELLEIRWQIIQQNEKLDQIIDILRNRRNTEAQELVRQGLRHYINEEHEEAEERFKEALKSDTTDYQVLMNLGFIEVHKNNVEGALNYFTKAVKLPDNLDSPSKARALRAIARVYYTQENYEQSFSLANQASQQDDKSDSEDIFMLGVYGALAGKHDIALQKIEQAILINPSYFSKASANPDLKIIQNDVHALLGRLSVEAQSVAIKTYEKSKDTVMSSMNKINDDMKDTDFSKKNRELQDKLTEVKKLIDMNEYSGFINAQFKVREVISSVDKYMAIIKRNIESTINDCNSDIQSGMKKSALKVDDKKMSTGITLTILGAIVAIVPAFKGCSSYFDHLTRPVPSNDPLGDLLLMPLELVWIIIGPLLILILIVVAGGTCGFVVAKIISVSLFDGGHSKDVNDLKNKKATYESYLRLINELQNDVQSLYDKKNV